VINDVTIINHTQREVLNLTKYYNSPIATKQSTTISKPKNINSRYQSLKQSRLHLGSIIK